MLTLLPLTVIDGAENVLPKPPAVSWCHVAVPLTAQKNDSEWPGPSTAMFTDPLFTVMDGAENVLNDPATVSGATWRCRSPPSRTAAIHADPERLCSPSRC